MAKRRRTIRRRRNPSYPAGSIGAAIPVDLAYAIANITANRKAAEGNLRLTPYGEGWSPVRESHPPARFCRPLPGLLGQRDVRVASEE